MFKRILVPVDGSDGSWLALEQALEVAREEGSTIVGQFVADTRLLEAPFLAAIPEEDPIPTTDPMVIQITLEMGRRIHERGEQVLRRLKKRCQKEGVEVETVKTEGVPSRSILEQAKHADLIVLGRYGEGARWSGPMLGSTFEAVVRHAEVPVLAAHDKVFRIQRVLLAYDGSARATDAMNVAAHLVNEKNRTLVLLTVDDGDAAPKEAFEQAQTFLKNKGVDFNGVFAKGHAAEQIVAVGKQQGCDLIVMGAYGHSLFVETLFGSTVDDVMRGAHCPVLICR